MTIAAIFFRLFEKQDKYNIYKNTLKFTLSMKIRLQKKSDISLN